MLPDWLQGQKIGILGFGVNNAKLTEWLLRHGAAELVVYEEDLERAEAAQQLIDAAPDAPQGRSVLTTDTPQGSSSTTLRTGLTTPQGRSVVSQPHAFAKATDRDVIFRSAGIHPNHPALQAARRRGVRISSQSDLFLELCPAITVGITGTKGKGTTALLLAHLLSPQIKCRHSGLDPESVNQILRQAQGDTRRVYLAGNIGTDPFAFLDQLTADDIVVLELSSGQLQDMTHSPRLAIVLDITEDHLDYHASFGEYLDAKKSIVRFQKPGDIALLNLDSPTAIGFGIETEATVLYYATSKSVDAGGYLKDMSVHFRDPRSSDEQVVSLRDFPLPGPHHLVNATAAVTAALILGQDAATIEQQLPTFTAGPHRMEVVAEIDGVQWVNDSYGSIPIASAAAIQSFPNRPLIVLVGGRTKGLSWKPVGEALASANLKRVLSIGETGPEITQAAILAGMRPDLVERVQLFGKAIDRAADIAEPGDVVLLAPASTSFDQFKNATERGERFRERVRQVIREHPSKESLPTGRQA